MPVRGSARLSVAVKEQIRAVQYDQQEVADCWEVFGTVQCKVQVATLYMYTNILFSPAG